MSDEQKKTMFGYAAPQMPSPAAPQQAAQAPQQAAQAPQQAPQAGHPGRPMGHMPPAVGHTPPPGQDAYGQQGYAPPAGQDQAAASQSFGQAQGGQQGYPSQTGHDQAAASQPYGQAQGGQQGYPPQAGQPYQQAPQGQQGYPPHPGERQPHHQQQYQQAPQGYGPGPGQPYQQQGYAPQAGGMPQARTASKGLFLGLHFGGLGVGTLLLLWGLNDRAVQELVPFAFIPILVGLISNYVLIYKAWASIQDGYAKTTPGKAVGFSFIPVFNIYWMFIAIGSWGKEYKAFTQRRGQQYAFQASSGLYVTHCILQLFVGGAALLITMPMIISQMCNGINGIAAGNLPRAELRQ